MAPTIFIILLGCNVLNILFNRIESTQSIIKNSTVDLFLSGGKKNADAKDTEAQIMRTYFEKNTKNNTDIKYILDEQSVNTAENFMRAAIHLNSTKKHYDKYYVVTSAFHHNRARKMLELIDSTRDYEWVLGKEELKDSVYWENIHIKNIYADVEKARIII